MRYKAEYTDRELLAMGRNSFNAAFARRFKKFLRNRGNLMASLMGFGCETDSGWNAVIWHLTEAIEKENPGKDFEIVQVKEKFGGLRYYVSTAPERIFELIDEAERLSYETCEVCGEPGSLDDKWHWYRTLCKKHKRERAAKKKAEEQAKFDELVKSKKEGKS